MTPSDQRRWTAYENLLKPNSGASESERNTAQRNLDKLRAMHPQGKPTPAPETESPCWNWTGTYQQRNPWTPPPETPEQQRAREAAKRRRHAEQADAHRERTLRLQREGIRRCPHWKGSPRLVLLHSADTEWTRDETREAEVLMKERRKGKLLDAEQLAAVLRRLAERVDQWEDDYGKAQVNGILNRVKPEGRNANLSLGHREWLGMDTARAGPAVWTTTV